MPFIKFENIDSFNAWHETTMLMLGIPDSLGTEIYSEHIVHPIDSTVVASVDERVDTSSFEVLSDEQLFENGYRVRPEVPYPF